VFFDARSTIAVISRTRYCTQKYGVGQPVRRKEDDTLVRGKGKVTTDDFTLAGQAYCWMVRSSHAQASSAHRRARLRKRCPAYSGPGPRRPRGCGYNPFDLRPAAESRDGSPLLQTNRPALATDKVRFVGDPVAFVVAETLAQARDAAESSNSTSSRSALRRRPTGSPTKRTLSVASAGRLVCSSGEPSRLFSGKAAGEGVVARSREVGAGSGPSTPGIAFAAVASMPRMMPWAGCERTIQQ